MISYHEQFASFCCLQLVTFGCSEEQCCVGSATWLTSKDNTQLSLAASIFREETLL